MVRCSFKIPVKAWRFKDDVWDYMTMKSWLECRGKHCSVFQDFIEDVGIKLNRISSAENLWNVVLCDADDSLDITFLTYNDNISLVDFYNMIINTIFPIFETIKSTNQVLVFSKKHFNKYSIKLEFTDKVLR